MKDILRFQNEILPAVCFKNEMLLHLVREWTVPSLSRMAVPLKFQILNSFGFISHGCLCPLSHFFMVSAKKLKVEVSEAP